MCVCVCVRARLCVRACVRACTCVRTSTRARAYEFVCASVWVPLFVYLVVCLSVSVVIFQ